MTNFNLLKEKIEVYLANIPKNSTATAHSVLSDLIDYANNLTEISNNGWISVDDRKPDNRTKVIAYFQHEKNKLFNIVELTIFNERYFNNAGHWLNWSDDGSPQYKVTHWQPLPEPPKE